MLDYLALACLFALCIGHFFLIRGCVEIKNAGGGLTTMMDSKMAETNNLLNEVAELLDEFVGQSVASASPTQTGSPLQAILSTFLNNQMAMSDEHASTEAERAIRSEILDSTTTTFSQDDERSEYSTEPIGA